jgi:hypothetical protein
MAFTRRRASPTCDRSVGEADLFGLFTAPWLALYGCAVAAVYSCFFVSVYRMRSWILGPGGTPVYTDFACGRIVARAGPETEGLPRFTIGQLHCRADSFCRAAEGYLPELPLSADFLADHGAVSGASLFLELCRLGLGDPARLFDRRVCDLIAYA